MRLLLDSLVALMLAGVLAGVILHYRDTEEVRQDADQVRESVRAFEHQIRLQETLGIVTLSEQGHPVTIDPEWFTTGRPYNSLLSSSRPWVEIAPPEDAALLHPRNRVADDQRVASFWYNPARGIVRARVPEKMDGSHEALYLQINNSEADDLFVTDSYELLDGNSPFKGLSDSSTSRKSKSRKSKKQKK